MYKRLSMFIPKARYHTPHEYPKPQIRNESISWLQTLTTQRLEKFTRIYSAASATQLQEFTKYSMLFGTPKTPSSIQYDHAFVYPHPLSLPAKNLIMSMLSKEEISSVDQRDTWNQLPFQVQQACFIDQLEMLLAMEERTPVNINRHILSVIENIKEAQDINQLQRIYNNLAITGIMHILNQLPSTKILNFIIMNELNPYICELLDHTCRHKINDLQALPQYTIINQSVFNDLQTKMLSFAKNLHKSSLWINTDKIIPKAVQNSLYEQIKSATNIQDLRDALNTQELNKHIELANWSIIKHALVAHPIETDLLPKIVNRPEDYQPYADTDELVFKL